MTLLAPGAARAAACSPLNCAPSQFTLAHGTLLAVRASDRAPIRVLDLETGTTRWRLPAGIVTRNTLVHQEGRFLTWFDAAAGVRLGPAVVSARPGFRLVGTSQDGFRAVLARVQAGHTSFELVPRRGQSRTVTLGGGNWSFDALRGSKLFLLRTLSRGYQVREYDLAGGSLLPDALKDPGESATISGFAFARVPSADGRYLFTLYLGSGGGAMVHELDLAAGTARCVDLPGSTDFSAAMTWALVPDPDGRTLWALSPGYGRVVAVDVAAHRIRRTWSFDAGPWTPNAGTAVLSPDGAHFALTDARHVWAIVLEPSLAVRKASHVVLALGWSPDQSHLWAIGERSRVSSLPLR